MTIATEELRGAVEDVRRDIAVLTHSNHARALSSEGVTSNALWSGIRFLCLDTERPVKTIDRGYTPRTLLGKQVLEVMSATSASPNHTVVYKAGDRAGSCVAAEPLFVEYANLSDERYHRRDQPKPVVVYHEGAVVGLFKPTERPGILGLASVPELGLFPGFISELNDGTFQERVAEATQELPTPGRVDMLHLFQRGAGMRVVRATTFAVDPEIRAGFSAHNRVGRGGYIGANDMLSRLGHNSRPLTELSV